jgi:hypothetical protein
MKEKSKTVKVIDKGGGPLGFVFFMAWVGSLVYFVQASEGFGGFILAILKSFVWPAFVMHRALDLLAL